MNILKNITTLLRKRAVYHTLIWLFFGVLFITILAREESSWRVLLIFSSISFPVIFSVYAAFYVKKLFFDSRKYAFFVVALLGIMILGGLFTHLLLYVISVGVLSSVFQSIQNNSVIVLLALGLQYFKRGIIGQYQLQELRAKTAEAELSTLKAQLNPHFLFNTLNNIYATNQIDTEKGSEMIMELSEVMRYHLQSSKRKMVSLEEEIQLIYSYIELEKLRLTENCEITINIENKKGVQIAPLLLLPFVENAFKHGTHPMQPCFIHLAIKNEGNFLLLDLKNSIINNRKVVKTHIGLSNTKRRLEILYPKKHDLSIEATPETYQVRLKIQL